MLAAFHHLPCFVDVLVAALDGPDGLTGKTGPRLVVIRDRRRLSEGQVRSFVQGIATSLYHSAPQPSDPVWLVPEGISRPPFNDNSEKIAQTHDAACLDSY